MFILELIYDIRLMVVICVIRYLVPQMYVVLSLGALRKTKNSDNNSSTQVMDHVDVFVGL